MSPQVIHLPNGQNITVTPVFAGLFFKSNEPTTHSGVFPIGWTIVIHTEGGTVETEDGVSAFDSPHQGPDQGPRPDSKTQLHTFTRPTLQNDSLFISSISNPSNQDYKPAASPTRQIAMMLWVTLYWYFHQPPPPATVTTEASRLTPQAGRPRGEWRVRIKRDGVLRGHDLMAKLERMGLIASCDSSVGTSLQDTEETWANMFVTQKMFWQIPGRLFLFSRQPVMKSNISYPNSPTQSRPESPTQGEFLSQNTAVDAEGLQALGAPPTSNSSIPPFLLGPFYSGSYLPTYYPPPPLQYTITNHVRHPLRPKPPRMGEVFYTRFIPSIGQYLSFRVASLSPNPVPYMGPIGSKPPPQQHLCTMSDTTLLKAWFSSPRVTAFWGDYSPTFLTNALQSRHSFPVIGLWDGVPFGYFEIYWVKEDLLGRYAGSSIDDWDRGLHVLIGEEWARGRVQPWLTSLVHWMLCADYRTMSICVEPRVDNARSVHTPKRKRPEEH